MAKKIHLPPVAPDRVSIRMYCMGTGDCFVIKFYNKSETVFNIMIDCGSCAGGEAEFKPYVTNLAEYVKDRGIDLLIVTHEHQDHVNGFYKCKTIFDAIPVVHAWFAWTEDPSELNDKAAALKAKRETLRKGFTKAMNELKKNKDEYENDFEKDFNQFAVRKSNDAFLDGLNTLAEINLPSEGEPANSLPGMVAIKKKVEQSKTDYLYPGDIKKLPGLPGIKFHVLGPPIDKKYVFKEGKQGRDVYNKYFSLNQTMLAANAYNNIGAPLNEKDLPFDSQYVLDEHWLAETEMETELETDTEIEKDDRQLLRKYKKGVRNLIASFEDPNNKWRKIEHVWLAGVGALALRLNSHINNTSLALAIEIGDNGKVLLFPGDAEYGSWESWHLIEEWKNKGKGGKHLTEDLLNRVIFYKVSHHLSYNGTPTEKGINMMPTSGMVAMATLDRNRISKNWKSTMPNTSLLCDLIKRCDGKFFIMNEFEIPEAPSTRLDPATLASTEYDGSNPLYKEYTFNL